MKVTSSFVKHKSPLNTVVNITINRTSFTPLTDKHKAQQHHFDASKSLTSFTRNTAQTLLHLDE
jgi:hypothetical protein